MRSPRHKNPVEKSKSPRALAQPVRLRVLHPDGSVLQTALSAVPIRFGRSAECEVQLLDRNASRVHAEIDEVNGRLFVRDCSSLNGTRLNGRLVVEASLGSRDMVQIGDTRISVVQDDQDQPLRELPARGGNDDAPGLDSFLEVIRSIDIDRVAEEGLDQEDTYTLALAVDDVSSNERLRRVTRAYTSLLALMNLVSKVSTFSHPRQVCEQFVEALKRVFPLVENAAVVLVRDDASDHFEVVFQQGFSETFGTPVHPSTTVLRRVITEMRAVHAVDAAKDPRFENSESVSLRGVRSMMCSPLLVRGEVRGAVYAENLTKPYCFGQFDLSFFTIFVFHLCMALETARLVSERDAAFEKALESVKAARKDKTTLLLQYSQSERKFRALFEQSALGAAVINLGTGAIEEVNDGLVRMLGFSRRQFARMRFADLLTDGARAQGEMWLQIVRRHGEGSCKTRLQTRTGDELVALQSCKTLRIGETLAMVAYFIDITGKEQAEAQIKTQLQRVTALSELSIGLLQTLDPVDICQMLREKVRIMMPLDELQIALQWDGDERPTLIYSATIAPDGDVAEITTPAPWSGIDRALEVIRTGRSILLSDRPPDETRYPSIMVVPMSAQGHFRGFACVRSRSTGAYDPGLLETLGAMTAQAALAITNARSFQSLREQEESLRALSLQIMTAQETERGRISRELHDGIGQQLTAMKYVLEGIRSASRGGDEAKLEERITEARSLATQIIDDLRTISLDLRPTMLDDLGLEPALGWLVRQTQRRTDLQIDFEARFDEAHLKPEVATAVYRIVQEGLGNTVKHSRAKSAKIQLLEEKEILSIRIVDDGVGFDPATLEEARNARGCSGMLNMKERARFLGGQFRLESSPGAGTMLHFTIPVKAKN